MSTTLITAIGHDIISLHCTITFDCLFLEAPIHMYMLICRFSMSNSSIKPRLLAPTSSRNATINMLSAQTNMLSTPNSLHSGGLLELLSSLISDTSGFATQTGQVVTPSHDPTLNIPSDVILPLLGVFDPFTCHDSRANPVNGQIEDASNQSLPLGHILREAIKGADSMKYQGDLEDITLAAQSLAALRLVKTLVIRHIPSDTHLAGLTACAEVLKSCQLSLGLRLHTIVSASEAVRELELLEFSDQPQPAAFRRVLKHLVDPEALVIDLPLVDHRPPRHDTRIRWAHERTITRFASGFESLQCISVHNIVNQHSMPQRWGAEHHFHFAQYPFVEPPASSEWGHWGTPPLIKQDRHLQIFWPLLEGLGWWLPTEMCESLKTTSWTFHDAEAMLIPDPSTVEEQVRHLVDDEIQKQGDRFQAGFKEEMQAKMHFVASGRDGEASCMPCVCDMLHALLLIIEESDPSAF